MRVVAAPTVVEGEAMADERYYPQTEVLRYDLASCVRTMCSTNTRLVYGRVRAIAAIIRSNMGFPSRFDSKNIRTTFFSSKSKPCDQQVTNLRPLSANVAHNCVKRPPF